MTQYRNVGALMMHRWWQLLRIHIVGIRPACTRRPEYASRRENRLNYDMYADLATAMISIQRLRELKR